MLTALIVYGIGKKLNGSLCGIIALLLTVCWPSQIIYSNINGAEAVFTFILFAAAYLAISTMKKYTPDSKKTAAPLLLHIAIGLLIAGGVGGPPHVRCVFSRRCALAHSHGPKAVGRQNQEPAFFPISFSPRVGFAPRAVLAGYLCGLGP